MGADRQPCRVRCRCKRTVNHRSLLNDGDRRSYWAIVTLSIECDRPSYSLPCLYKFTVDYCSLLNDDDRQSDRTIAVSSIELKREPKRDRSLFTKIF